MIQIFSYKVECYHPPVAYSIKYKLDTKPIAIKNRQNFLFLYLSILNSSTITSTVAIYKKVPAEIDVKIPVTNSP